MLKNEYSRAKTIQPRTSRSKFPNVRTVLEQSSNKQRFPHHAGRCEGVIKAAMRVCFLYLIFILPALAARSFREDDGMRHLRVLGGVDCNDLR